jgi:hypothetical protein
MIILQSLRKVLAVSFSGAGGPGASWWVFGFPALACFTRHSPFSSKTKALPRQPILGYSSLCHPILAIFDPLVFSGNQDSLFIETFLVKPSQG